MLHRLDASPVTQRSLDGSWTLSLGKVHPRLAELPDDRGGPPAELVGRRVPATVPGCVHTDLLAAGLIPDPYLADHELHLLWIGRCDWTYTRTFDADATLLDREHVELCFDGLDTVAAVWVNGKQVLSSRDMHLRQRVEVRPQLKPGANVVTVRFAAPVTEAVARRDALGPLPHAPSGSNPPLPHNFLRKMACNMGWDWGPVVPTCGIWRSVRLEAWDHARLGDLRPAVLEASPQRARLRVEADVHGVGRVAYRLTDPAGEQTYADDEGTITVPNPARWWPIGHGDQPLYTLTAELRDDRGELRDAKACRVGLRTVTLDTSPDPAEGEEADWPVRELGRGEGMTLRVNGKPIYCKGANWIPDDCFPSRVDAGRYRRRIEQAAGANMNMLRIWGGGLYESHDLYDLCDELGVMVWQDFLCACAAYPEEAEFPALIEVEARDNVSRLAHHASLVLWNGCNENLWGYRDWNDLHGQPWPEAIGERGWGLKYYFETFPKAVAELVPGTPYWPASPASGPSRDDFDAPPEAPDALHPNANTHGNRHVWNVWHGPGHYLRYFGHHPRFCSEFGFHGPPTHPTLTRAIPPAQRAWDSPVMRLHNKNGLDQAIGDGQNKATARMADDFVVPGDFDDWLFLSTVMQARALTVGVGWFRSLFPWNSGALFWQLNDCWPCSSWSAIDGDGRAKPLLHAARRFFAPRVINLGPDRPTDIAGWGDHAGPLRAYLHNDDDALWEGTLRVRRIHVDGRTLDQQTTSLRIEPRGAAWVEVTVAGEREPDTFLLAEMDGGERAFWWFAPDKEIAYPAPEFDTQLSNDGTQLTVTARTLLRDLCLFPERLHPDASTDDACVTLLPGESHEFAIHTPRPLDPAKLTTPPVLRCVTHASDTDATHAASSI